MLDAQEWTLTSRQGGLRYVKVWPRDGAQWIALLAHGYGEHIGRYGHVAEALRAAGAVVVGPDHEGHGRSEGERALIADYDRVCDDLHAVAEKAAQAYPGLPVVLIGHSMGGMIAADYAQRYGRESAALVLSGPMFGTRAVLAELLAMDPVPDIPLDPATLSRDPAVGRAYAEDPLVWHGPFKAVTLKAMLAAMARIESGPSLGALPTLWIHGEADPLVPLAETRPMMEKLRGTRFEEKLYPGAMHEVFNETNKDEVIADVIDFVRRQLFE
jgi:alpha-beta hydrolase superfamily lysophospholipase